GQGRGKPQSQKAHAITGRIERTEGGQFREAEAEHFETWHHLSVLCLAERRRELHLGRHPARSRPKKNGRGGLQGPAAAVRIDPSEEQERSGGKDSAHQLSIWAGHRRRALRVLIDKRSRLRGVGATLGTSRAGSGRV